MIGDELVDVVLNGATPTAGRRLRDWLREASRPPADLSVHSDFAAYTGVVIIENNKVVAALVIETARGSTQQYIQRARFDVDPYFCGDDDELR